MVLRFSAEPGRQPCSSGRRTSVARRNGAFPLRESDSHHPDTSFGSGYVAISRAEIKGWQRTVAPSPCSAEPVFSSAASFGICAIASFPSGSRQGIQIVGKVSLALMIRNFKRRCPPQTLDTELSDTLGCALINIIRVVQ